MRYQREHGYSPTQAELGAELGVSQQSVSRTIARLRRAGIVAVLSCRSVLLPTSGKPK